MAHELTKDDTMYSHQVVPWHFFETSDRTNVVDTPPKTIEELLSPAYTGTNWQVEQHPVFTITPAMLKRIEAGETIDELPMDEVVQIESNWANMRSDTGTVLGVVGDRQEPLQNIEVAEFVLAVVGTDEARFETGGSLKGGRTVWYMMELLNPPELPGGEKMQQYLSAVNWHNGKGSFTCMNHAIRIVCNNTCTAALKGAKNAWTIRHTESIRERVQEAQVALGLAREHQERFVGIANDLALRKFTKDDFVDVLGTLYPIPPESTPMQQKRILEKHEEALGVWNGSPNLDNIRNTAWGAWNGLVEYVDHGTKFTNNESRMLSIMSPTGRAYQFKARALATVGARANVDVPVLVNN